MKCWSMITWKVQETLYHENDMSVIMVVMGLKCYFENVPSIISTISQLKLQCCINHG